MSEVRIGVSGWSYPEWRGVFYPKGLVQKHELRYVGERLNSVEINGTFYSLQSPKSFQKWSSEVPDEFIFAMKGSKFITHQKKLNDVRIPLANFFASGLLALGKKLGPIVWQFAPWYHFNPDRIESFLQLLPQTTEEAAALAEENTIKLEEKAWTKLVENVKIRYAFEPRHESFFTSEFVDLLAKYNAALVFADSAGKFGYGEDITADFVYIRLHGNDEIYVSDYSNPELDKWSERITTWKNGGEPKDSQKIIKERVSSKSKRDVYVYFDNSMNGYAASDAVYLAKKLGIKSEGSAE